jgi:carbon monoxide dehydrogenase subunit G
MRVVEKFITSAQPDAVWRVLADVEHWRDWTPTVTEIKPVSASGLTVGARYRVVQPKLKPAIYEVTECVPSQTFTWVQRVAGGVLIADHRLSSHDGATEVELSFTSKGLLANIIGKMFSRIISDYVATEAKSLKNQCDSLATLHKSEVQNPARH